MIEGEKNYLSMTNMVINFNKRLLEEIKTIIKDGQFRGEIQNKIDCGNTAIDILESLQNHRVLWAMNQNINMKILFEISFKHLWNSIKLCKRKYPIFNNGIRNQYIKD